MKRIKYDRKAPMSYFMSECIANVLAAIDTPEEKVTYIENLYKHLVINATEAESLIANIRK